MQTKSTHHMTRTNIHFCIFHPLNSPKPSTRGCFFLVYREGERARPQGRRILAPYLSIGCLEHEGTLLIVDYGRLDRLMRCWLTNTGIRSTSPYHYPVLYSLAMILRKLRLSYMWRNLINEFNYFTTAGTQLIATLVPFLLSNGITHH